MNELLTRLLIQADKLMRHIYGLFETTYGFLLFFIGWMSAFVIGEKLTFTLVILAIIGDLALGIITSIKQKRFTKSHLIQDTFVKIIVYGVPLLLIGLGENHFAGTKVAFYAACALAFACELWSISAHLLILAPNLPFLKILRFQLQDEIKNKTGKSIDELIQTNNDTK